MAKLLAILALVIAGHLAGPWIVSREPVSAAVMSDAWDALIYALTGLLIACVFGFTVLWLRAPWRDEENV